MTTVRKFTIKFSYSILRVKIVATRDKTLRQKCTKFVFGPRWKGLQRPPDSLAGFEAPASKGGGRRREGGKRRE